MKESDPNTCPKCAAAIPDEAPGGLCPKCALEGVATAASTTPGGRKSAPPGIAEIAQHFPELEILELIGAGGMGAVYKARQPQLDRFVALKILSHDLAGDPAFVERFNREARVLARLGHPNIVGIHDFGTAGPYCYLTMELVDGVNLRQAMQAGRFTPTEALAMVQHLCSALKFAHEEGILHRDIKPENILIDSKGRVKIADFGIAKLVGGDRQHDVTLTLQGSVLGSPHYMAPEQIETPGDVDQRADIYSLGVVLYEMLTGGLPIGRFALPSEKAAMDARIDHIVMRTLEKERERRYQTVGEMKTEFDGIGNATVPTQAAFINWNKEILDFSKYTFRIAMIFLMMVLIDLAPAFFGEADDLPDTLGFTSFLAGATIFLSTLSGILRVVHTIRTRGGLSGGIGHLPTRVHAPIRRDQGTAHLGLTGAILTGVSLLLAGVTVYVANTLSDANLRMIVYVVGVGVDGPIAILGFILGARALFEIRRSGGVNIGLGSAIFATTAWPILALVSLGGALMLVPMPGDGRSISHIIVIFAVLPPVAVAAWLLVRSLYRWAGGVPTEDGGRRHPGLGRSLLLAVGLIILGPLLLVVASLVLPASERPDQFAEMEREMERVRSETAQSAGHAANSSSTGEVRWRLGKPELAWTITVESGMNAKLQLLLKDQDGSIRKFPLGDCATQINGSPGHGSLELGTVLTTSRDPVSAAHAMTVLFWSGRDGRRINSSEDLRGFHFIDSPEGKLVLDGVGTQVIPVATRFAEGQELATGMLSLEAVVSLKSDDDK